MTALIVIGAVVSVLLLAGLVPAALDAAYEDGRFSLTVRLGPVPVSAGGAGKKAPKKPEKPRREPPSLPVLKILAKNAYNTLCRVVSRLRVEVLKIHFTAAWPDPGVTAMAYAGAGTAMEALLEIGGDRIERPDLRAEVDFEGGSPLLDCRIRLSLRLYRLAGEGLRFGFGLLRDYIKLKRMRKHGKSAVGRPDGGGDG